MKILLYKNQGAHRKNANALQKYKNIQFTNVDSLDNIFNTSSEYDCVLSFFKPIDISKYPNILFIFGPQFSVFPDENLNNIKGKNSYYNLLSEWVVNFWKNYEITNNINFITIPFGVETDKFIEIKPIKERSKVFVYSKIRDENELKFLINFLMNKNIEHEIFVYDLTYNEEYYLQYLQESKYGIILGRHESQGFAIQEALSCNVPLFVWDVKYMNQEVGMNYPNYPATSIPYWDERCGEFFYDIEEIENKFELFLSKLETFEPRNYILENLSMEVCEKRLMDFVNKWNNNFRNTNV